MRNSNTITVIDLARKSIWKGETRKAFSLIFEGIEFVEGKEAEQLKDQLYIYSNNYTQLENSQRQNIISNSEYILETNKVTSSLLRTISDIEIYLTEQGQKIKKININNSFDVPRDLISDTLYYGFLVTGLIFGSITGLIFMWMYYRFLISEVHEWKELFFIASIGVGSLMFLSGVFDGLNRQKKKLIDWRLILPHCIIGVSCLSISGIIAMYY